MPFPSSNPVLLPPSVPAGPYSSRPLSLRLPAFSPPMVASLNYDQYTPFPRALPIEPEGFQSSEEDSEPQSPLFEQPLAASLPMECASISRSIPSSAHLSSPQSPISDNSLRWPIASRCPYRTTVQLSILRTITAFWGTPSRLSQRTSEHCHVL